MSVATRRDSESRPPLPAADPRSAELRAGQDLRVLWIDDDAAVTRYASQYLSMRGFSITVASSAAPASELIAAWAFDAVVLDLRLPDRSGLELLADLRRAGHQMPVIVLTGYPEIDTAFAAGMLGASQFRIKPLVGQALVAAVRDAVATGAGDSHRHPRTDIDRALHSDSCVEETLDFFGRDGAEAADAGPAGDFRGRAASRLAKFIATRGLSLIGYASGCKALSLVKTGTWLSPPELADSVRALLGHIRSREDAMARSGFAVAFRYLEVYPVRRSLTSSELVAACGWPDVEAAARGLAAVSGISLRRLPTLAVLRGVVRELATTPEQVAQIAYGFGYEHPSQLDRDFHRFLNMAPSEFRRRLRR